jgi:nucleotide-binding universal stress UspA family protein
MPDINRIVCPIDFSEPSRHALEHAVVLARWYTAPVVTIHVHTPARFPTPGFELAGYGAPPYADTANLESFRQAAHDFAVTATAGAVNVETVVEVGPAASSIVQYAGADPTTLIVIGTHGASGFQRLVLGSVTEKVLRTAKCPVMTVPPRAQATSRLPYKRILCPIDFSTSSADSLQLALSLAKEGDAKVTLMHVTEWPSSDEEPPSTRAFNVPEYRQFRDAEARAALQQMIPGDAAEWCSPDVRVAHGKPYQEILRHAADEGIDVIVMGVHGRGAVDQMIFGSTTNQVIRQATCPVITQRH